MAGHIPVLVREVLHFVKPSSAGIYIDCNLGAGGHARALLEASSPNGVVIGFDWDAIALEEARGNLSSFGDRVVYVHRNFAEITDVLTAMHIAAVDGILLDLGLSSMQLDKESRRGFSFLHDAPLDMRMDSRRSVTAREIVNKAGQDELADIFFHYGEERQARRIAAAVVEARHRAAINTSFELAEIVRWAVPKRFHPKHIHVATKVFQALRIAVNDELRNLEKILRDGAALLRAGGVLCAISFHSLEDRIVKRAFQENSVLRPVTPRPITPDDEECRKNPRARSAKLRVASKVDETATTDIQPQRT